MLLIPVSLGLLLRGTAVIDEIFTAFLVPC
jgi:hypothetical protein